MRSLWLVLALCACQRKTGPSQEYARALELYSQVYAEKANDAFTDPKMYEAEDLLARVSPRSNDAEAAKSLAARIEELRAQAQRDRASVDQVVAKERVAVPPPERPRAEAAPPDAGPEPDAGAAAPVPGMPLAEFTARFGDCFVFWQKLNVVGVGLRETYVLKDRNYCRDRLPTLVDQFVVLGDGEVSFVLPRRDVDGGI